MFSLFGFGPTKKKTRKRQPKIYKKVSKRGKVKYVVKNKSKSVVLPVQSAKEALSLLTNRQIYTKAKRQPSSRAREQLANFKPNYELQANLDRLVRQKLLTDVSNNQETKKLTKEEVAKKQLEIIEKWSNIQGLSDEERKAKIDKDFEEYLILLKGKFTPGLLDTSGIILDLQQKKLDDLTKKIENDSKTATSEQQVFMNESKRATAEELKRMSDVLSMKGLKFKEAKEAESKYKKLKQNIDKLKKLGYDKERKTNYDAMVTSLATLKDSMDKSKTELTKLQAIESVQSSITASDSAIKRLEAEDELKKLEDEQKDTVDKLKAQPPDLTPRSDNLEDLAEQLIKDYSKDEPPTAEDQELLDALEADLDEFKEATLSGNIPKGINAEGKISSLIDVLDDGIANKSGQGNEKYPDNGIGLYDRQIDEIMSGQPRYLKTIARDEILDLVPMAKHATDAYGEFGFIMNLDSRAQASKQHWVAVYCDPIERKELCYYDSFGEAPIYDKITDDLKKLVSKLNLPYYLKFKYNTVTNQAYDSNRCGIHAMLFLDKMFSGQSFKEATNFNVNKSESDAIKEESKLKKFGMI